MRPENLRRFYAATAPKAIFFTPFLRRFFRKRSGKGNFMASITREGRRYKAEVRRAGVYRTKRFNTKTEAQLWAAEIEIQLGLGRAGDLKRTLYEAMEKYGDEVSPARKGARWEQIRLKKLMRDPLAQKLLCDISRDDLQRWIERQTISASSICRELNLLSAVFKKARINWNWMQHNPITDLQKPKKAAHRDRRISDGELARILLALDYSADSPVVSNRQFLAVAALLALETAMRQGELFQLRWADVHLQQRFVRLHDTKNGTARDVALSKKAVALFESLPRHSDRVFPMPQESSAQIFRRAVALAGIEDFRFHDLRHEAITRLARKLDMLDLARMVGHRDVRSLQIYYNATASEIASRLD